MKVLRRLFKKKEKKEKKIENATKGEMEPTELEKICSNSPEIFEALKDTMFLDPRKVDITLEDAITRATKFEKKKDKLRAAVLYKIAGGLAIYKGDVSKVKKCFGKYSKLTGRKLKILENTDEAVKKATEYYKKYLKEKKKTS